MTASDKYTYQRTVLCLARVLAGIQPTPWEKVRFWGDRISKFPDNRLFALTLSGGHKTDMRGCSKGGGVGGEPTFREIQNTQTKLS